VRIIRKIYEVLSWREKGRLIRDQGETKERPRRSIIKLEPGSIGNKIIRF
jgi:hypothetical protein